MGMACDAEGQSMTDKQNVLLAKTSGVCNVQETRSDAPGMNPEETAMILTSLSKGFSTHVDEQEQFPALGNVHRVQQINFDGPEGRKLDFTDDAGCSHRFRNESNRVKSLVTKHISIEELRAHFDRPIIDVAKDFGICITLMKKICRRNGIKRWPHRQIRSLSKSIASMEAAMLSAQGREREKYRDQIMKLKLKRESVIADPNKDNSMHSKGSLLADTDQRLPPLQSESLPQRAQDTGVLYQSLTPTAKMATLTVTSSSITGNSKGGRWTCDEHAAFLEGIRLYGKDWRRVAQVVKTRSAVQTRTHAQKYLLKFAGRFTFDAEGRMKDHQSTKSYQSTESPLILSPSNTATDDCTSIGSWNSEEGPKHGESLAMILNGSPTQQDVKSTSASPIHLEVKREPLQLQEQEASAVFFPAF